MPEAARISCACTDVAQGSEIETDHREVSDDMSGEENAAGDDIGGQRPANWSEKEICILTTMWGAGKTNAEIAAVLNRRENAVAIKASRLHLPRKEIAVMLASEKRRGGPKSKIRPCLTCRRPFFSEGSHHRMCDCCKQVGTGSSSEYVLQMGGVY